MQEWLCIATMVYGILTDFRENLELYSFLKRENIHTMCSSMLPQHRNRGSHFSSCSRTLALLLPAACSMCVCRVTAESIILHTNNNYFVSSSNGFSIVPTINILDYMQQTGMQTTQHYVYRASLRSFLHCCTLQHQMNSRPIECPVHGICPLSTCPNILTF